MDFGQKIFSWNWFIWFHEFFGMDFFKFSGLLWHIIFSISRKNFLIFLYFLQDLFSEALDDKIEHLDAIESAHYIYPVDVKSVLTNQDLKTIVCRNFWKKE